MTDLQEKSHAVSIDGHEDVPIDSEDALLKAAAHQPISVAIEAGGQDFRFYSQVRMPWPMQLTADT